MGMFCTVVQYVVVEMINISEPGEKIVQENKSF